jgi:hypothetical protein
VYFGLLCLERRELHVKALAAAALCFVLAFATKLSAIQGVVALGFVFLVTQRWSSAFLLGLLWAGGVCALLALMFFGSEGRVTESFGLTLANATESKFAWLAPLRFFKAFLVDPANPVLTLLTLLAFRPLWRTGTWWKDLVFVWAGVSAGVTAGLFLFHGIDLNHVIDLSVPLLVLVTWCIERGTLSANLALKGLLVAGALGIVSTVLMLRPPPIEDIDQREAIDRAWAATGTGEGQVLTENPWVSLVKGERPFVIAPSVTLTQLKDGTLVIDHLTPKLKKKAFRAVILEYEAVTGIFHYQWKHFGFDFVDVLNANYKLHSVEGHRHFVYLPR